MKPIIFNADYLLDPNLMDFSKQIEIHVTRFFKNDYPQHRLEKPPQTIAVQNGYDINNTNFKVFIDCNEPKVCYMKEKVENILQYGKYYNLILTSTEELLNNLPNAKKFLYGTTWLNKNNKTYLGEVQENFKGFDIQKQNSISFLKSNKIFINEKKIKVMNNLPGYILREKIWPLKSKINHPTLFYYSNVFNNYTDTENDGVLPNDDKLNIFKSKFSIIIENSQETNYFSEKLIDCLLTKTIPIYWGCPNITEYFDKDGFIFIENENDFLSQLNTIKLEKYYSDKKQSIEKNFEEAKKYALNFSKRVEAEIKRFI
jgi:hypothetical protein